MASRSSPVFTVIGDVVGSREHGDQMGLIASLREHLAWVAEQLPGERAFQPLGVTIGDEFQGAFTDLDVALRAVTLCQLRALPAIELRFGVGHGTIEYEQRPEDPMGQSGSGWWSARQAIEQVEQAPARRRRTCAYVGSEMPLTAAVQAFLILRDHVVRELDVKDRVIAAGLLCGRTQKDIATQLGIQPSSVSRRGQGKGIIDLVAAHDALRVPAP